VKYLTFRIGYDGYDVIFLPTSQHANQKKASMCMAVALGPVMIQLREISLEHPNVLLFAKFLPRCRATYDELDIAGVVIDMAAKLNLSI
jgi:hypothetical protein